MAFSAAAVALATLTLGVPVTVPPVKGPEALAPRHTDVLDGTATQLPADRQAAVTTYAQRYLDTVMAAPCGSSGSAIAAALAAPQAVPHSAVAGHSVSITSLESSRVVAEPEAFEEHLHLTFATSVGPLKVDLLKTAETLAVRNISPTSFLPECHRKRLHGQKAQNLVGGASTVAAAAPATKNAAPASKKAPMLFGTKHGLALRTSGGRVKEEDDDAKAHDNDELILKPSPSPDEVDEGKETHLSSKDIQVVAEPLIAF